MLLFVFGVFLFPAWSEAIGPQVENITFTPWEHSLPPRDEQGYLDWKAFGENVLISRKASLYSPQTISLGNKVRIDEFCILSGLIEIGNFVHISA